ncbi:hypothetical protein HanHA300_Chr11g0408201 [Helianthus annuus]|nr:hypothetical protein HanHA300_Chr11g0408201 [Helianthus annuus]KAJ0517972.1 hypothetical protein HanHA89_Chr11g0431901 [Helianthus annuus]KAJ0685991.1 hypothetical protein HanLR1_Chr11g0409431 [Helianthus annuus]KAJ0689847.1 hypothetical protein HanOQP8_Chr11g0410881 [Helianthus annuus]
MRPDKEPAARRRPSERKQPEVAVSLKAEMVDLGWRFWFNGEGLLVIDRHWRGRGRSRMNKVSSVVCC